MNTHRQHPEPDDRDRQAEHEPSRVERSEEAAEEERKRQERGNRGPDEVEGFGQGA